MNNHETPKEVRQRSGGSTMAMAKRPSTITRNDLPDHVEIRFWDEKEIKEDIVSQTHSVQTTEDASCMKVEQRMNNPP